ncbi:MAG: hypothetical protein LKG27_01825 [Clostridiaceae bacterium]|jgi:hypothetical protein|nr:hypothetical protein [Clostridiaceae bacterium]
MDEIMTFFKGIFSTDSSMKVGLSQFKEGAEIQAPTHNKKERKKETKLSDLMRGI